jgi:GNAT superfamily N-acetyltransferase
MLHPRPIPAMLRCNNSTMDNRNFPIHLDSGEAVLVRPIGRHDADRMRAGIAALSDHSRYLRFFNGGQTMPEHVIERLCDADGWKHVAWGAIDLSSPGEPAIGAVHAIRKGTSCDAELALAVLDDWHGKGLARLLLTGVIADARRAGITHLTAETFAENRATRQLFRGLGGLSVHRDGPVVSYRFDIETAAQKLEGLTQNAAGDLIRSGLDQTAPAQDLEPSFGVRRSV